MALSRPRPPPSSERPLPSQNLAQPSSKFTGIVETGKQLPLPRGHGSRGPLCPRPPGKVALERGSPAELLAPLEAGHGWPAPKSVQAAAHPAPLGPFWGVDDEGEGCEAKRRKQSPHCPPHHAPARSPAHQLTRSLVRPSRPPLHGGERAHLPGLLSGLGASSYGLTDPALDSASGLLTRGQVISVRAAPVPCQVFGAMAGLQVR